MIKIEAREGEPMWYLEDQGLYLLGGRFYRAQHLGYREHGLIVRFALHEAEEPFTVLDAAAVAAAKV